MIEKCVFRWMCIGLPMSMILDAVQSVVSRDSPSLSSVRYQGVPIACWWSVFLQGWRLNLLSSFLPFFHCYWEASSAIVAPDIEREGAVLRENKSREREGRQTKGVLGGPSSLIRPTANCQGLLRPHPLFGRPLPVLWPLLRCNCWFGLLGWLLG